MDQLALHTHSSIASNIHFCAAAHANSTHPTSSLQPAPQHPAFALGKLLGKTWVVTGASWAITTTVHVASYIYSKWPSFSFAGASTTTACPRSICKIPTGSYEESCSPPEMTYLPDEDECELVTHCTKTHHGLPSERTTIRFAPAVSQEITVENQNGTLVVRALPPRAETLNARLQEASNSAATPQSAVRAQGEIIATLPVGTVITITNEQQPAVISSEEWPKDDTGFSAFQRFAKATGGLMALSPSANNLPVLLKHMLAHILKMATSSDSIDIAFVIDTTGSMGAYIGQVKSQLAQLLEHLKKEKANNCRFAVVQYRDKDDDVLVHTKTDLSSDLVVVGNAVLHLIAHGGQDVPEAALDALLWAKNKLSWNSAAKRIVVLISDAPPHPKTADGRYGEADVIAQYQEAGTQIAVYPVFSES